MRAKTARYSSARIISASLLTFDILTLPTFSGLPFFDRRHVGSIFVKTEDGMIKHRVESPKRTEITILVV